MTEWLNVNEEDVDVEEIMCHIKAYIAQQRRSHTLEDGSGVRLHFSGRLSPEIYDALSEAFYERERVMVSIERPSSSIPLLGQLVSTIKYKFHQLVIYYINKSAFGQISFNTQALKSFGALIQELDRNREEIDGLQEEVAMLKRQVRLLESK